MPGTKKGLGWLDLEPQLRKPIEESNGSREQDLGDQPVVADDLQRDVVNQISEGDGGVPDGYLI